MSQLPLNYPPFINVNAFWDNFIQAIKDSHGVLECRLTSSSLPWFLVWKTWMILPHGVLWFFLLKLTQVSVVTIYLYHS